MHIHTISMLNNYTEVKVWCDGCGQAFRLADRDEAIAIRERDLFSDDGPILGPTNVIAVPIDFILPEVSK